MNENKRQMLRVLAEVERGNFDAFVDCLADDVVWTLQGSTPWSRPYRGKAVVVEKLFRPLFARLAAPYRMRPARVVADDDVVVIEGRGDNVLADGRRYDNGYCWVCRLEDGKVKELTEYMDTALVVSLFAARA